MEGAHVEAVGTRKDPVTDGATVGPVRGKALVSEQPVEAASTNLYDVLVGIARAELIPHEHELEAPGVICTSEHIGEERKHWSPSAFGKCDRALVLEHAGVKKNPFSDKTALFFWIGKVVHNAVQEAISKKLDGQVWNEVRARDDEYKVSGKLDTLRMVRLPDGSYEVYFEVYEYKTIRAMAFAYSDLPYDHHVLQVAFYLTFPVQCPACSLKGQMQTISGVNLERLPCEVCGGPGKLPLPRRARIAYINKEDGFIRVFEIENAPELQALVKAKLVSMEEQYSLYKITGQLPEKLKKVQITEKGVPQFYKRDCKGGKKGDPKLKEDYRTMNCDYKGQKDTHGKEVCCAEAKKGTGKPKAEDEAELAED